MTNLKDGTTLAKDAEATYLASRGWLASGAGEDGSGYQAVVDALCDSDPRLRSRDPKAVTQKIPWRDYGRVVVLEAEGSQDGGGGRAPPSFGPATEFRDAGRLREYLSARRKVSTGTRGSAAPGSDMGASTGARRTVYILEGLGPGFAAALGEHFALPPGVDPPTTTTTTTTTTALHPSAFLDHERVIVMNVKAQGESDGVLLPSLLRERGRHVTLRYFEPLQFDRRPASFRLVCADTGRHIGVARGDDGFTDVGVARRKCTFWTRRAERGEGRGGWECLVICDPPITSVRTGDEYRVRQAVKTWPYQGGYVDFAPQAAQARRRERARQGTGGGRPGSPAAGVGGGGGPPRSSMLDDLVFYLREHAADIEGDDDPDVVVGTFVREIVASHYFKLAEHLRATLSAAQRALSRKHDLASLPMEKVEELWSDVQAWERRVGEYCEDLEAIMLQLGVPLEAPDTSSSSSSSSEAYQEGERRRRSRWSIDPRLDFQFLLLRFRELRHRTECLNSAVTGLASITGNRQAYREQQLALEAARRSIREAKSSKAVTLLGLIFIPLAYTSSVFSMTEPYGPGGDQFWQYFAASAPLILVVLAGYWALDVGYTDDGTSWSPDVFVAALRARVERLGRGRGGQQEKRRRPPDDEKGE